MKIKDYASPISFNNALIKNTTCFTYFLEIPYLLFYKLSIQTMALLLNFCMGFDQILQNKNAIRSLYVKPFESPNVTLNLFSYALMTLTVVWGPCQY